MEYQTCSSKPHVLIIPHPLQGHVNPMLYLAEIFCLSNFNVTFLSSTHIHQHLTRYTDLETRFSRYPGFRFRAIPDGLPDDHVRAGDDGAKEVCATFRLNLKPVLMEMLGNSASGSAYAARPVTCLVVDGWIKEAHDLGNEVEIPVIMFRCFSASCVWVYFCFSGLVQAGEIPFKDDEDTMDKLVKDAPGIDNFLRYRDLPRFCREKKDMSSWLELQQSFDAEIDRATHRTHALILNTCEELEGPLLDLIRSRCPKTYSVGPLHYHLKTRLDLISEHLGLARSSTKSSSGLWDVHRNCMTWLEQKKDKSVVYVCFGSIAMLDREQLIEIWAGLVQSQAHFLWAVRPDLIIGSDSDSRESEELLCGTKDRGYITGWVPQAEVLAHKAIGGFLTHSGWNSTLESITAGVPMICWPYFGDQQVNSRCVSELWEIGLDMKDTCDRNTVAKMVKDVMVGRKGELVRSVARLSALVKRSVVEGGSSYCNLDGLIKDIKQMSMKDVPL